jgi:hypothetical protein
MSEQAQVHVDQDAPLGLTVWIETHTQAVSVGLDESWYVRSVVSLPADLTEREIYSQICEELHIQFPSDANDWLFDFVAWDGAPPVDGLRVWEVFALAGKNMAVIRKMCDDKQWRLTCVAPLAKLAQAQLGTGVCFYPSRKQRLHQLWRKRCIKSGLGVCAVLALSFGGSASYSLASAYWGDVQHPATELVQAIPMVESHPRPAPWMVKEFERIKEPLERHNLEDLRLVGFIQQGKSTQALIRVKGQQSLGVQSVRLGDYLGKNFGRVLQITPNAVLLNELHQVDAGEWKALEASLQLVTDGS